VSLRHHDPQRQNYTEADSAIENAEAGSAIENAEAGSAIENAEAGSAIECFCSKIVVSHTDARTDVVN
jgi:hypothetical protein